MKSNWRSSKRMSIIPTTFSSVSFQLYCLIFAVKVQNLEFGSSVITAILKVTLKYTPPHHHHHHRPSPPMELGPNP